MNLKNALALGLLATSLFSFAGTESSGGGGAGICLKEGACKTLAQSGFRLGLENNSYFEIEQNTIQKLKQIKSELPQELGFYLNVEKIIGGRDDLVGIEIDDQSRVKKFIKEYKAVIRAQNPNFDFSGFELLAFTSQGKTYLILDKYNRLDEDGKALLLIHEAVIREFGTTFDNAVRMDGMILDYLKAKREGSLMDFDFWSFYRVMVDAHVMDRASAIKSMLGLLLKKGMPAQDFVKATQVYLPDAINIGKILIPIYSELLSLRQYHPRIAQDLRDEKIRLPLHSRGIFRRYVIEDITKKLPEPFRESDVFVMTVDQINEVARSIPNHTVFSHCGDYSDESQSLAAYAVDEYQSSAVWSDCKSTSYVVRSELDSSLSLVLGHSLVGATFTKGIRCVLNKQPRSGYGDKLACDYL